MSAIGRRVPRLPAPAALRVRLTLWCLALCAAALALFGILLAREQQDILLSSLDTQLTNAATGAQLTNATTSAQLAIAAARGRDEQFAKAVPEFMTGGQAGFMTGGQAGPAPPDVTAAGATVSRSILFDVEPAGRGSAGDAATVLQRLLQLTHPKDRQVARAQPGSVRGSASVRSSVLVGAMYLDPSALPAPACTTLSGWRLCRVDISDKGGRVIAVAHAAELLSVLQPSVDTLQRWLLIVLPLVLVLTTLGCWALSGRALAPIDRLTREARRIGATDLRRRLGLAPRNDEVGRLAATLDEMLARLEAAFAQQQAFTAAASHELRTPLTIVRGNLDVVLERPRRPAEYREALREMRGEVGRLSDLVEDLLTLARADSGTEQMARDLVALDAVVTAACADVERLAHDEGIALEVACAHDVLVMGDDRRLRHTLLNLLDNAIRYTPPGGTVRVTLETRGAWADVRVADTGIGIAPDDLPHIFDRFYRADAARSRDSGGAGLGLAIARWCVEAHGGAIDAASQVGQGTTVTVSVPLALTLEDDEVIPAAVAPRGLASANTVTVEHPGT